MSILPTTRINYSVPSAPNGIVDPGIPSHDEDILLVDFQPVVVPNAQILSSPSTTNSTAMYPIPPSGGMIPGAHMVGMNHHHPSVSSDGKTTPISATGSLGKGHNPNHYSLVSLSNHHAHHNNTSREESDLNYHPPHPPSHLKYPNAPSSAAAIQRDLPYVDDDEKDEFARHQALAQPSYMLNKRRSRRIVNRDNHMQWDNTNHVGYHPQQSQPHLSSSLSSSEDSDTGFLMGTRKTAYTRKSVQRVVDPHTTTGAGGNGSPSASTGLLPNLANRKRVRRKRPSARNRKPVHNQRDKMPNPSDVLSVCCCLCDDDPPSHSNRSSASSLRNRYFRLTCVIICIIVVAVLASITVSLQRKVDMVDLNLRKLDQAVGSPLSTESSPGATTSFLLKPSESLDSLLKTHNELNATVITFKTELVLVSTKLLELQKQLNATTTKLDGIAEVRRELATLGSRVQDLTATVEDFKKSMAQLQEASRSNPNAANRTSQADTVPTAPPS